VLVRRSVAQSRREIVSHLACQFGRWFTVGACSAVDEDRKRGRPRTFSTGSNRSDAMDTNFHARVVVLWTIVRHAGSRWSLRMKNEWEMLLTRATEDRFQGCNEMCSVFESRPNSAVSSPGIQTWGKWDTAPSLVSSTPTPPASLFSAYTTLTQATPTYPLKGRTKLAISSVILKTKLRMTVWVNDKSVSKNVCMYVSK